MRRDFFLERLSPECATATATSIAQALSKGLNATQVNALGVFITSIGDMLSVIAAQSQLLEETCEGEGAEKDENTGK